MEHELTAEQLKKLVSNRRDHLKAKSKQNSDPVTATSLPGRRSSRQQASVVENLPPALVYSPIRMNGKKKSSFRLKGFAS